MHIPGHLAVALAHFWLPPFSQQQLLLKPLLMASLFPDVVDKTIGYLFHLMPNGRHYAHNIFSLVGLSLIVALIWGKAVGFAWFIGYLSHLLVDSNGAVPWYFPAKQYEFVPGRLSIAPVQFLRETAFLVLVIIIYRASRR